MLQIPLSFKGPTGIISHLFSEKMVFDAIQIIISNNLQNWQYKESHEIASALIADDNNKYTTSVYWPLNLKHEPGSCNCNQKKPCVHICALTIETKSRLDQIPPFTGQLQANRNIIETLGKWIDQQKHDPYPNMARHRLVYFLDCDENEEFFSISLHKAYLSKEDKYQLKSKLTSSVIEKKPKAKFITLADEIILKLIQYEYGNSHKFTIQSDKGVSILKNILQTNRCFWKNCYRTPLNLEYTALTTDEMVPIAVNAYIAIYQNTVYFLKNHIDSRKKPIIIHPKTPLLPVLTLCSFELSHPLLPHYHQEVDVAKITFKQNQTEFSFDDLSEGIVKTDPALLNRLAGLMRQIEKIDSVYLHFEPVLLESFHINDRYLGTDIRNHALLLSALKNEGWEVKTDKSFRLNKTKARDWFAKVKPVQRKNNWFDLELGITIDGQSVNLLPFITKAIKSGKFENSTTDFHIKLKDGQNIDINHNSIQQILSALTELYDEKSLTSEETLQLSNQQILRLKQVDQSLSGKGDTQIEWKGDSNLINKARQWKNHTEFELITPSENLKATLRNYQITGLSWLYFLQNNELGGILADDMGLGKTLQVLAHLLREKNQGRLNSPCLIVVPTSLLSNWQNEINKYAPDLSCLLLAGTQREKLYTQIACTDIVITSYGIMTRDVGILHKHDFYYLILDEAQTIKNSTTLNFKAASSLSATHKLCLTGTPVENHLGELWSLFQFLMPGFLGTRKQYDEIYRIPIEKHQKPERQQALSNRVAALMLRRTKSEVATELPEKSEMTQLIELQQEQSNLYEMIRLSMSEEIKNALSHSRNHNSLIISNALLRLRQICCHPSLLKINNITTESAKLIWLETVLPNMLEEGRKILIFSSFTQMLNIIRSKLDEIKISSLLLTGQTPAKNRGQLIEDFQAGKTDVFLISLKAGGAGINLTRADTVIHFDPWWNPAAESQASDRAHRIGQQNKVFVYKLIARGTVEEKIHQMQQHKSTLAESIFDKQGNISKVLSETNWQELFKPLEPSI